MNILRKPDWLKIRFNNISNSPYVNVLLKNLCLNTVCEQANCPNRLECFNKKTAAFMILGKVCTRNCTFCDIESGKPEKINSKEADSIIKAVDTLKLKHVVVTSVTRDDLLDGGAFLFADVINKIKKYFNDITVEVLIPDFQGSYEALKVVVNAKPDIINHNIETVPRLYESVRSGALYERSLELLCNIKDIDSSIISKSGIMLGLGESDAEIKNVFSDLRNVECDFLTIGQYLSPSKKHHPVIKYYHPDEFQEYKEFALSLGYKSVSSGPFVRSSYNAEKMIYNDG